MRLGKQYTDKKIYEIGEQHDGKLHAYVNIQISYHELYTETTPPASLTP